MSTKRLIMTTALTEEIFISLQEDGESISGFANAAIKNGLVPRTPILQVAAESIISKYAEAKGYNEEIFEETTNLLTLALRWLGEHHIQSPDVLWKIFQYIPLDCAYSEEAVDEGLASVYAEQAFTDHLYEELKENPNYRPPRIRNSRTLLKDILANWKYMWDSQDAYLYFDELFFMESSKQGIDYPEDTPLCVVQWVKELEEEYIAEQF